jgi:hypothetical protein
MEKTVITRRKAARQVSVNASQVFFMTHMKLTLAKTL